MHAIEMLTRVEIGRTGRVFEKNQVYLVCDRYRTKLVSCTGKAMDVSLPSNAMSLERAIFEEDTALTQAEAEEAVSRVTGTQLTEPEDEEEPEEGTEGEGEPDFEAGAALEPAYALKHAGGKYYHIVNTLGDVVSEKAMVKSEAEATLQEMNAPVEY